MNYTRTVEWAAMTSSLPAMQIILNGEAYRVAAGTTLDKLVEQLGLKGRRLAVERNGAIVPRSAHPATVLEEGDRIEIVHAIGGG